MKMQAQTAHLLVIDAQERLFAAMSDRDEFERRCRTLLSAAAELDVPVAVSEQYPAGLGPTIGAVRELATAPALEKMAFSWFGDAAAGDALARAGRSDLVLVGMEAHVCVLQTALDAREAGFNVFVVADAVLSRTPQNRRLGLERMAANGVEIVSTEMVAFEWLGSAAAPAFRSISRMIR